MLQVDKPYESWGSNGTAHPNGRLSPSSERLFPCCLVFVPSSSYRIPSTDGSVRAAHSPLPGEALLFRVFTPGPLSKWLPVSFHFSSTSAYRTTDHQLTYYLY